MKKRNVLLVSVALLMATSMNVKANPVYLDSQGLKEIQQTPRTLPQVSGQVVDAH